MKRTITFPRSLLLTLIWMACHVTALAQNCVPPLSALTHWWRGEGNPYDTISTEDGIILGGVQFAPGKVGTAFLFSGSGDDYIALPENLFTVPAAGTGNVPFSFEVWFQTSASGAILGQQDMAPFDSEMGGYVPAIYVGTNGILYVQMFWGAERQLVSPGPVNEGQFHHVVVTYDGALERLYLDAVLVDSIPLTQEGYASLYYYELGTAYTGGWDQAPGGWFPFTGIVDEPSLYNRALTDSEVALLFAAGPAGKCAPPGAGLVLRHRFSFNGDPGSLNITDSVRRAHGFLVYNSATAPYTNGIPDGSGLTGKGTLELRGTSGCVSLPPRLISVLTNFTIEAWFTWDGPRTSVWQRVFDFGISDRGTNTSGVGTNYVVFTPARGATGLPSFEQTTVNPFGTVADPKALVLMNPTELPIGQEIYMAITYDPQNSLTCLYLNGLLVASSSNVVNASSQFKDYSNWLGRSQWQRDPLFTGSFNEFRIWQGALGASDVASHYAAGPDQQFVTSRPAMRIVHSGNSVTLSWQGTGMEPQLQSASSPDASQWNAVNNQISVQNNVYSVTLPITGTSTFYRLR